MEKMTMKSLLASALRGALAGLIWVAGFFTGVYFVFSSLGFM